RRAPRAGHDRRTDRPAYATTCHRRGARLPRGARPPRTSARPAATCLHARPVFRRRDTRVGIRARRRDRAHRPARPPARPHRRRLRPRRAGRHRRPWHPPPVRGLATPAFRKRGFGARPRTVVAKLQRAVPVLLRAPPPAFPAACIRGLCSRDLIHAEDTALPWASSIPALLAWSGFPASACRLRPMA